MSWELYKTLEEAVNLADYGTYKEIEKYHFVGPWWYWLKGSRDSGHFTILTPKKRIEELKDQISECKSKIKDSFKISLEVADEFLGKAAKSFDKKIETSPSSQ